VELKEKQNKNLLRKIERTLVMACHAPPLEKAKKKGGNAIAKLGL